MPSWSISPPVFRPDQRLLARLVTGIGSPAFAQDALDGLANLFQVGSWAVYELHPSRQPHMHFSASRLPVDSTGDCFATYRDAGLYRQDRSFDTALRAGPSKTLLLKADAADMTEAHRQAIYVRHAMLERLSVAQCSPAGSMLAVNLYRHEGQGCFAVADAENLATVALPLMAAVRRHIDCGLAQDPAAGARTWLLRCHSGLTERELDVLELLLRGLTYDGIAAHLGLGVGTVKTYRARAFQRLGIHFKNQLFALALRA